MTTFVIRDGKLVERDSLTADLINGRPAQLQLLRSSFPSPRVSRMTPFESPVTGADITTWRERDADMKAVDAVDPRDLRRDHVHRRGRQVQLKEATIGRGTE